MLVGRTTNLGRCGSACSGAGPSACGIGPFTSTLGAICGVYDTPCPSAAFACASSAVRAKASCSGVLCSPPGNGSTVPMRVSWETGGALRPPVAMATTSPPITSTLTVSMASRLRAGIARATENTGSAKPRELQVAEA